MPLIAKTANWGMKTTPAIDSLHALLLLVGMGLLMFAACRETRESERRADGYLVADRSMGVWRGALSIAVSWIWAPAIFICSMQAYEKGVAGIFWFTAPNILCFFIFTPVAIRLRSLLPEGYSFPDFIATKRYPNAPHAHVAYLIIYLGYQLSALIINALAGGYLLNALSGLDLDIAIILFATIPLAYTVGTGLKASVITDAIQMTMVLGVTLFLVPACLYQAGGTWSIKEGLGGISGAHGSILDPWIAFSMGIPMTLGLISGPLADQMFFQRAMSCKPRDIGKVFILGAVLFAVVPLLLSLLGFMAVPLSKQGLIEITDTQFVGLEVIKYFLPPFALYLFTFMAFAGLLSTIDSAMVAASSLVAMDIYKRYCDRNASDTTILRVSRLSMLICSCFAVVVALLKPKLLWVFLIYGALASAGFFPTLCSLYSRKLSSAAASGSIGLSLAVGLPFSIYANYKENPFLIVCAALLSFSIGLIFCLTSILKTHFGLLKVPKESIESNSLD